MKVYRSILLVGFLAGGGCLWGDDPPVRPLQLALAPRQAASVAAPEVVLPPAVEVDFTAVPEESEVEPFRPHESQVRLSGQEVKAGELLKRERCGIHGSVSVGVNSRGEWETSLELYKQVTPILRLAMEITVGRWDRWD